MKYKHTPVMLKEVLEILNPRSGQNFIDCTLGGGGYTVAIAKRILPGGKILAVDLDELAMENFKVLKAVWRLNNAMVAQENFKNLTAVVKKYFKEGVKFDGIALDLGLSSAQLEDRSRGFSFSRADSPLGMNFGKGPGLRADDLINKWSPKDLTEIFRDYGEEKFALKIARAIIKRRQTNRITTAGQLAEIIISAVPKRFQSLKMHPATKIFQSLRIAVNDELENLRKVLPQAVGLLKSGGKLAVISYHSLEDRIVKQYFKQEAKDCLCPPKFPICQCHHQARLKILTRKVLRPTEAEVLKNPRSRSARLRVAEKI